MNAERVLLNDQTIIFNEALAANRLLRVDGVDDIHDALDIVKKFAPSAADSLTRRLPGHYAAAIKRAIVNEEFELANDLSIAGLKEIPGNKNLNNLVAKIEGAEERAITARNILRFTASIQDAIDNADGLAGFLVVQEDVKSLSSIDPDSALLASLGAKIAPLVNKEISALSRNKDWGASDIVQNSYSDLLLSLGMRDKDARATKLRSEFESEINRLLLAVGVAVASDNFTPPSNPNATGLVENLESIAPGHRRTLEARVIAARGYLSKARVARDEQKFDVAQAHLTAANKIAPDTKLNTSLETEKGILSADSVADTQTLQERIADRKTEFEQSYQTATQSFSSLDSSADAIAIALARLDALESLVPTDSRLPSLRGDLIKGIGKVSAQFAAKEQWSEAVSVTRETLAYAPDAKSLSENLMSFESKQQEAELEQQRRYVVDRKIAVETLLGNPTADRKWSGSIQRNMAEIQILATADDPWIGEFKNRIAGVFIAKATEARKDERFAEGANMLERATRYAPELNTLATERLALASATDTFERERREQERLAVVEGLKQDFRTQAQANDVSGGTKTLSELQRYLGDKDPFITRQGPQLLADAYYKLAAKKAEQQDFAAALKLAKAGLKLRPQGQELRLAVKDYTVDGNRQDLKKTFSSGSEFNLGEALEKISEVQTLDPRAYGAAESDWAEAVTIRLRAIQKVDGDRSNPLVDRAKEVFPGNVPIASLEHVGPIISNAPPSAARIRSAMDAALLSEAKNLLKNVSGDDARHAAIIQLKGNYNAEIKKAHVIYEDYKSA
ncbi:MAG: hypothetical protein VCB59_12875, partial [Gammaproteobacteria bacterium]